MGGVRSSCEGGSSGLVIGYYGGDIRVRVYEDLVGVPVDDVVVVVDVKMVILVNREVNTIKK